MAEENSQNRRYPQNLQGLLQLAVDAGSAAEGPAPAEPMSEEVKKKGAFGQINLKLQRKHRDLHLASKATEKHSHTLSCYRGKPG